GMFPSTATYLPQISWDPTTAAFWNDFNGDPAVLNVGKEPDQPGYRFRDYRLSADELNIFKKLGFVVSERLGGSPSGGSSFGDCFYGLWTEDLPVFISCDALLQAWHRTYDAMLEEIEETYLVDSVGKMLDAMTVQVDAIALEVGNTVLKE